MNYEEIMQEISDRIEGAADCYVDVDGEGCMESAILASEAVGIAQDVIDEKAVYRWRPIEAYRKPEVGGKGYGERQLVVVDCGPGSLESVKQAWWDGLDWYIEDLGRALQWGYRVTQYMPMPSLPGDNQ